MTERHPWSDEETDNPLYADDRNFYKVESGPGRHAHRIACYYGGNNLDKARKIFVAAGRASGSPFGSERECCNDGRTKSSRLT
jgi:hypothetical protein